MTRRENNQSVPRAAIVALKVIVSLASITFNAGAGPGVEAVPGGGWGSNCHAPCTCEMSSFSELPIASRIVNTGQERRTRPTPAPATQTNQATYDENQSPDILPVELLKMAVCVLLNDLDTNDLLFSLPADLQALTLLQGRGSGPLTISDEALAHFPALTVLDVQGLPASSDQLTLSNRALSQLTSLRHFSAEFVHLEFDTPDMENEIQISNQPGDNQLVFLEPAGNDLPLVSFKEFKAQSQANVGDGGDSRDGLFSFASLPSLELVRVHGCDLRELAWQMFRGLSRLEFLSLERNKLRFIPEFAFYGSPALKSLSLAGNELLGLQDTALAGLFHLERLDLSGNNFSHLSELSLPPFPNLRIADFRFNPVTAIYPSTFEIMNATAKLLVGGTDSPLSLLANSFLGLSSLRWLTADNVDVSVLQTELLRGMPQLTTLQMTGRIDSVAFDAFLHVPRLRRLTLRHCRIRRVSMDAFYGLRSLVRLDLSQNEISSLPPGVFDQQTIVKEILLQGNQLTTLPVDLLSRLPAKMVRLEGNPWHCSCAMRYWKAAVINVARAGEGDADPEGEGDGPAKYVADKRVAPRCATPAKYRDWNVFHLLRKQLPCGRSENDAKYRRSEYILRKHAAYFESLKTVQPLLDSSASFNSGNNSILTTPTPDELISPKQKEKKIQEDKLVYTESKTIASSSKIDENISPKQKDEKRLEDKVVYAESKKIVSPSKIDENISPKQKEEKRKEEKVMYAESKKIASSSKIDGNISPKQKEEKRKEEKVVYAESKKIASSSKIDENISPKQKEGKRKEEKVVYADSKKMASPSSKTDENTSPKKEEQRKEEKVANAESQKEEAKMYKMNWKLEAEKKREEKLKRLRV